MDNTNIYFPIGFISLTNRLEDTTSLKLGSSYFPKNTQSSKIDGTSSLYLSNHVVQLYHQALKQPKNGDGILPNGIVT